MTQHYKDSENNVYGYKPSGVEVTPITMAEVADLRAPTQEQLDQQRIAEIDARLKQIDAESVRPLRASLNGTATQYDTDRLAGLDSEAQGLRDERKGLTV